MSEKIQKVLARAGFASRRQIEQWITEGRIKVNQQVATLGDRISDTDRIQLDGRYLSSQRLFAAEKRVIIYHKDIGTVCSRSDDEGRRMVFEDFPAVKQGRWVLVGRLDITTSGLLIVTTDGELANRLMHPSYEIEREYLVRVLGNVDSAVIDRLSHGVELDDGMARFESIVDMGGEGANHWYRVVVKEGRNREVRRLWESQGVQVSRLSRIRYGCVSLPKSLRRGHYAELSQRQRSELYETVGLAPTQPISKPYESKTKKSRRGKGRPSSKSSNPARSKRRYAPK